MKRRSFIFLYILAAYVVLQLAWWMFYIIDLNRELQEMSMQFAPGWSEQFGEEYYSNKILMIAGEGAVFFLLLLIGIFIIHRNLTLEDRRARAERNFILSVSHELKTPLASMRLLLQTIASNKIDQKKRGELIETAIAENQRLSALTDNILLVTKFERGGDIFFKEPVDFSEITENLTSNISRSIGRKHIVRFDVEPGIFVNADAVLLESVLSNLIENAVKYSPEGSEIAINLISKGDQVYLTVADQGIGISDKERNEVFRKFFRSGDEQTRSAKGTGLGLYIVDKIVRIHEGVIEVMPNTPEGTIFAVQIPRYKTDA